LKKHWNLAERKVAILFCQGLFSVTICAIRTGPYRGGGGMANAPGCKFEGAHSQHFFKAFLEKAKWKVANFSKSYKVKLFWTKIVFFAVSANFP
jgi:hypothetical protein